MWIDVHMFSNYTVHLLKEKTLPDQDIKDNYWHSTLADVYSCQDKLTWCRIEETVRRGEHYVLEHASSPRMNR
jgi:hypothetical protein